MTTTPTFLQTAPRFFFFTGKGGVGKTSIACATAVWLADQGKHVLLVSTDPASNVGQVFGQTIGAKTTPIPDVPGLWALEIDPDEAATAYRERVLRPLRGQISDDELKGVSEQLSGSCTTEVASFDEFTTLLANPASVGNYDHIVFDTAPTGHTIRLLQLPGSWTDFLDAGKGKASCLGPMAGLDKQRTVYAEAVAALKDDTRTRVVLVARAQTSALTEGERTRTELGQLGIRPTHLVINGVLSAAAGDEPLAQALRDRETDAIHSMAPPLAGLEQDIIQQKALSVMGVGSLRGLFEEANSALPALAPTPIPYDGATSYELGRLVEMLAEQDHGLILCMGKGGVGKTTIAAAIAVALARRGNQVHLATTDPAGNLTSTLRNPVQGLTVSRIDPVRVTRDYRDHIMATKGARLDPDARSALAEDLQSPCTEEVAVFREFSKVIRRGRHQFVVVDTAPTGHTLLLLDAAGSYHRDVVRHLGTARGFVTPMMLLQDPELTKVVVVTLPEPTPVAEARGLQEELTRAGITPWAWVVNSSLAAARPRSPFLRMRAAAEEAPLAEVRGLAKRVAVVPVLEREPVGEELLAQLAETRVAATTMPRI